MTPAWYGAPTRTHAGYEAAAATCHESIFRVVLLHLPCQVSLPSTPDSAVLLRESILPHRTLNLHCTAPSRSVAINV